MSAKNPCSLLLVETFTDRKFRLLGGFAPCSFGAEDNMLHFQRYPLLVQSLAAIPHALKRATNASKIKKHHKLLMKDTKHPNASVSE